MARYFVTRHSGAREWAKRRGLQTEVVAHLEPANLRAGDIVMGTLPVHLAAQVHARGARYLHLTLDLPPDARGTDLTADDMERYGARLETFQVSAPAGAAERPDDPGVIPSGKDLESERKRARRRRIEALLLAVFAAVAAGASTEFLIRALDAVIGPETATPDRWQAASINLAIGLLFGGGFAGLLVRLAKIGSSVFRSRAVISEQAHEPPRRVVVTGFSPLAKTERQFLIEDMRQHRFRASDYLGELPSRDKRLPHDEITSPTYTIWQQTIRALFHHRAKLKTVVVIPPAFSAYEEGLDTPDSQFDDFRLFLTEIFVRENGCDFDIVSVVDTHGRPLPAVDYENYDRVQDYLRLAVDYVQSRPEVAEKDIMIDVTPGFKPFSIAAAVATFNGTIKFSYVTSEGKLRVYDASIELFRLPGT